MEHAYERNKDQKRFINSYQKENRKFLTKMKT